MAPSHSSCERREDLPTAPKLLAAGRLVPATYFYSYVSALQLTASSPGGEGTVCGKGQAPSLGNVLVLREENGRMAAAAFAPSFLPRGGTQERAGT